MDKLKLFQRTAGSWQFHVQHFHTDLEGRMQVL
jgi:hypothetical protein